MPSLRDNLRQLADSLIDDIIRAVRTTAVHELAGMGGESLSSSSSVVGGQPLTPEQIAKAILALPTGRNRLRVVEGAVVREALARTNGNVSAAARLLGIERKAVERRIARSKA